MISNTASRIAELRKRIRANKGIAQRARDSAMMLRIKANDADAMVRNDQREIEELGGKVRR